MLYAWNPLAVMETAGSGHVEPLGVLLLLLAACWVHDRHSRLSAIALAASIQVKLLPLVLAPGFLRRAGLGAAVLFATSLLLLWLPYAITGPAVGAGLFDYAERWEHNAFVYAGVQELMERIDTAARLKPLVGELQRRMGEELPWDRLYAFVWPRELARLLVALTVVVWTAFVVIRRRDTLSECLLVLGAVMLLSPTLHPWYVLWILPFAAARLSRGWLLFAMTVPLAYWVRGGDVPWIVRCVEWIPPLAVMIAGAWRWPARVARPTVC